MRRRILHLLSSLDPLGPWSQVRALSRELVSKNYDIHVTTLENTPFEPLPDMPWHPLQKLGQRDMGRILRLRKLIRDLQPEMVHAWGRTAINAGGLVLYDLPSIRFLCTQTELRKEPSLVKRFFRRKFHRRPEKLTVPHESMRTFMVDEGVREHRLVVVPNAAIPWMSDQIPSDALRRQTLIDRCRSELRKRIGVSDHTIVAGAAARLEPGFRWKDLIWAADLLACIRNDFHFTVFGEGFQLDRLKKFLTQTDAAPFVHFVGLPTDTESLLLGLDVFWNAHLRSPANSLLLSAMADGIPAVSVLGAGVEEIVLPQVTALATNFGARDEFSRWTKYLIEQDESRQKLARQGAEHVRTEFAADAMVRGFEQIYDWY